MYASKQTCVCLCTYLYVVESKLACVIAIWTDQLDSQTEDTHCYVQA